MELGITGIHHVQIGVRPEDEAACRRFYGGILGMKEAPKPVPLRKNGGAYFYLAGIELHLSLEETPENVARGQHVCFEVDDLARAEAALRAGGVEIVPDLQPIEEWERFYVRDPAGVRVEFAQVRRA
ncbi:MAG: VOC family protein [Nitrospinota bacterium]